MSKKMNEVLAKEYDRKMKDLESSIQARKKLLETLSATIIEKENKIIEKEDKIQELDREVNILQEKHDASMKNMLNTVDSIQTPTNTPVTEQPDDIITEQPKEEITETPKSQITEKKPDKEYDQIIIYQEEKTNRRRRERFAGEEHA